LLKIPSILFSKTELHKRGRILPPEQSGRTPKDRYKNHLWLANVPVNVPDSHSKNLNPNLNQSKNPELAGCV
jgi:hypothetical protein